MASNGPASTAPDALLVVIAERANQSSKGSIKTRMLMPAGSLGSGSVQQKAIAQIKQDLHKEYGTSTNKTLSCDALNKTAGRLREAHDACPGSVAVITAEILNRTYTDLGTKIGSSRVQETEVVELPVSEYEGTWEVFQSMPKD